MQKILFVLFLVCLSLNCQTGGLKDQKPIPPMTFDFECGCLTGWQIQGEAFLWQPTLHDNPTARKRGQPSSHQGNYWIGGYENYTDPSQKAGAVCGDSLVGSITSLPFEIFTNKIEFLIGGGCGKGIRLELLINDVVVRSEKGQCHETMKRKQWIVENYIGQIGRIRGVDNETGGWGHLNFDDIKFVN